jgi:Holliday junction DNA helicase RuvA
MIGRLKGIVASVDADAAIIDVGGVGYEVHGHARLLARLSLGAAASLSIETHVREDLIRLYAFESEAERRAFRLLQSVQGVGARHALSVLEVLPVADLYDAIAAEDTAAIARAHGVGRKLAQRICAELAAKVGALERVGAPASAAGRNPRADPAEASADPAAAARADAALALARLGYDGLEARRAVARAVEALPETAGVGELIKQALKELAAA